MHPQWVTGLLVVAALVAVVRVYLTVRRVSQQKTEDWDEKLVKNLRTQGGDPFSPQDVDFFFDLPDQNACEQMAAILGPRGFTVDFRRVDPERGDRFTLHALKSMRISVPEVQSLRREFSALAVQHGGRYDGWATSGITRAAGGRDDKAGAKRR
ncbi:MAG: ribonuclease E inhibitor RraB [Steroidobacteraceae bacterium]